MATPRSITCTRNWPATFFSRVLADKQQPCLVMLDGLDEVATPEHRAEALEWIEEQRKLYPGNLLLVTSRFAGYRGKTRLPENYEERPRQAPMGRAHRWASFAMVSSQGRLRKHINGCLLNREAIYYSGRYRYLLVEVFAPCRDCCWLPVHF